MLTNNTNPIKCYQIYKIQANCCKSFKIISTAVKLLTPYKININQCNLMKLCKSIEIQTNITKSLKLIKKYKTNNILTNFTIFLKSKHMLQNL